MKVPSRDNPVPLYGSVVGKDSLQDDVASRAVFSKHRETK